MLDNNAVHGLPPTAETASWNHPSFVMAFIPIPITFNPKNIAPIAKISIAIFTFLSSLTNRRSIAPANANNIKYLTKSSDELDAPPRATITAVVAVPMLAPKINGIAPLRVNIPALIRPIVKATAPSEDWIIVVNSTPNISPSHLLLVILCNILAVYPEDIVFMDDDISLTATRNSPRPPNAIEIEYPKSCIQLIYNKNIKKITEVILFV